MICRHREDWSCSGWSSCQNSSQSRACIDHNACGTTQNQPPETQSCTEPPAPGGGGSSGGTSTPPPPGGGGGQATLIPDNEAPTYETPIENQADDFDPCTPSAGNKNLTKDHIRSVVSQERDRSTQVKTSLRDRLLGRILLQVENFGEAWYLDPVSRLRHYLANGPTAYEALRTFGLGITNQDLSKIPVGIESRFEDCDTDNDGLSDKLEEGLFTDINNPDTDGDGFLDGAEVLSGFSPIGLERQTFDNSLVNRLRGRILLQVEELGQAWYINPVDGLRYYMKNGNAAYQIMRFLSLGITNDDLRKIDVGSFE